LASDSKEAFDESWPIATLARGSAANAAEALAFECAQELRL